MHVAYGRGSVLLWLRCNVLHTSGFVDSGPMAACRHCSSLSVQRHARAAVTLLRRSTGCIILSYTTVGAKARRVRAVQGRVEYAMHQ